MTEEEKTELHQLAMNYRALQAPLDNVHAAWLELVGFVERLTDDSRMHYRLRAVENARQYNASFEGALAEAARIAAFVEKSV